MKIKKYILLILILILILFLLKLFLWNFFNKVNAVSTNSTSDLQLMARAINRRSTRRKL